jgi:hypothetical protein
MTPTIDFGVTIRPAPQGGSVARMIAANERVLEAAATHHLTSWVIDHFQSGSEPIPDAWRFWHTRPGSIPVCAAKLRPAP